MTRKDRQRLRLVNSSPQQAAKTSGLRYVTDDIPGIARRGKAKKFFTMAQAASDCAVQPNCVGSHRWLFRRHGNMFGSARFQTAICRTPDNARNRKQYRYHSRWRNSAIRLNMTA